MAHLVPRMEFPELVIGLVAPIGSPVTKAVKFLTEYFSSNDYNVENIKVTDNFEFLKQIYSPKVDLISKPLRSRYDSYIAFGNQVRHESGELDILAALSIVQIVERRIKINRPPENRYQKTVYIVNQFKRPEEVELFRSVYGRNYFQVSLYSKREARVDYLSSKMMEDEGSPDINQFRSFAEELVTRDENEKEVEEGQRIGKIFHDADFIVNSDAFSPTFEEQIHRFGELIFGSNKITPTKLEYGMFLAKSAALRTSDLSRQVGAAIFSEFGEVLALGSNEVPKATGGTYWSDENNDAREFKLEIDSNDQRKNEILKDLFERIGVDVETLSERDAKNVSKSSFMDALEYGRIIHAEMSAITDASRNTGSLKGSRLFTTTFPCHMCAKHIVAAGIKEVFYLEPYPKSLAARLHPDSISIDDSSRAPYENFPKVRFRHFFGVTPRRYRELFERGKRKDTDGKFLDYADNPKRPFMDLKSPFYVQLEDTVMSSLKMAGQQT